MKVKMLSKTPNLLEVMYIAARTCYSSESPNSMFEKEHDVEKMQKLIKQVLASGHKSIAEHVNFSFAIEGISRACSHQLVRHRHCTFSQQSQRYVEIKESIQELNKLHIDGKVKQIEDLLSKYFIFDSLDEMWSCFNALNSYLVLVNKGRKPEDARQVLPNCTKTNLVMTCNLAELMHICNLRLCTRAQSEIRMLFNLIKKEVAEVQPFLAEFLVPSCEVHGYCQEHKCCGRKPALSQMIKDLRELASAELHGINAEMIEEEYNDLESN